MKKIILVVLIFLSLAMGKPPVKPPPAPKGCHYAMKAEVGRCGLVVNLDRHRKAKDDVICQVSFVDADGYHALGLGEGVQWYSVVWFSPRFVSIWGLACANVTQTWVYTRHK